MNIGLFAALLVAIIAINVVSGNKCAEDIAGAGDFHGQCRLCTHCKFSQFNTENNRVWRCGKYDQECMDFNNGDPRFCCCVDNDFFDRDTYKDMCRREN